MSRDKEEQPETKGPLLSPPPKMGECLPTYLLPKRGCSPIYYYQRTGASPSSCLPLPSLPTNLLPFLSPLETKTFPRRIMPSEIPEGLCMSLLLLLHRTQFQFPAPTRWIAAICNSSSRGSVPSDLNGILCMHEVYIKAC